MADMFIREATDNITDSMKLLMKELQPSTDNPSKDEMELYTSARWAMSKAIEAVELQGLRLATKQFREKRKR